MKIPRWYTRKEVKEWFQRRGISHSPKEIQMFTEEFQKAFEKGWQKCQQNIQSKDSGDIKCPSCGSEKIECFDGAQCLHCGHEFNR